MLTLALALACGLAPGVAQADSTTQPAVTHVEVGDSQAVISFSLEPDAPAGTTYTVTATPRLDFRPDPFHLVSISGGTPVVADPSTTSPVVVRGLSNGVAYEFAVTASNLPPAGSDPTAPVVSVTVGTPPTVSGTPPTGVLGAGYDFQFGLGGLPTARTALASGTLPPGLSLDSYGRLSGAPTTTGNFTFRVYGDNGVNVTLLSFTVKVVAPPARPTISGVQVGAGTADVTFTTGDPGTANDTSYVVVATPTAGGPAVRSAAGSGSPLTVKGLTSGAAYTFAVTASTATGLPAATITSDPSDAVMVGVAPTITGTPPDGVVNTSFSYPFVVAGAPDATVSVTDGALPPGLSLTSAGVLAGTPTAGGAFSFTVTATNALGTSSSTSTVSIAAAPGAPTVDKVTAADGQAQVSFTPGAPGFPAGATYHVTATPDAGSAVVTAESSGSPITVPGLTAGSAYRFVVTATGPGGSTSSDPSATVTVGATPTIAGTPPAAAVKTAYSFAYTLDGTPAPTTTVSAGTLPPGLSLNSNGTLSGTPTTAGSYAFTVTAANSVGSASTSTTLVVAGATVAKADVTVTLSAPATTRSRTYGYQVTVSNQGPATAGKVLAALTLPRGVSVDTASGSPTRTGRTLVWSVGAVPTKGQTTYTVNVRSSSNGAKTAAAVAGSLQTADPSYKNNITSVTTVVGS